MFASLMCPLRLRKAFQTIRLIDTAMINPSYWTAYGGQCLFHCTTSRWWAPFSLQMTRRASFPVGMRRATHTGSYKTLRMLALITDHTHTTVSPPLKRREIMCLHPTCRQLNPETSHTHQLFVGARTAANIEDYVK